MAQIFLAKHFGKQYVRFIRKEKLKMNKTGYPEPVPPILVPRVATAQNNLGTTDTWMYVDVLPEKKDGRYFLRNKSIAVGYDWNVNIERDIDQVFFLDQISPVFKNILRSTIRQKNTARWLLKRENMQT